MVYKMRIEEGVVGPVQTIVSISESLVDRAVFNACVRRLLGPECVSTTEELEYIHNYQMRNNCVIMEALTNVGVIGDSDEDMRHVEEVVLKALSVIETDFMGLVAKFAAEMQRKIVEREERYGNVADYTRKYLISHLVKEIGELFTSNFSASECIDVANLCCFLWLRRE